MTTASAQFQKKLILLCAALMLFMFAVDLMLPLGVAAGVPYIAVILLTLWSQQRMMIYLAGILCSLLTVLGFFYSPPGGEMWKVIVNRSLALYAIWVTAILVDLWKKEEEIREKALAERERAINELKVLRGYLPICASCKKIRDDEGSWQQIESYIRDNSEAEFSHGICPECSKKLYPEFEYPKKEKPNTPLTAEST